MHFTCNENSTIKVIVLCCELKEKIKGIFVKRKFPPAAVPLKISQVRMNSTPHSVATHFKQV